MIFNPPRHFPFPSCPNSVWLNVSESCFRNLLRDRASVPKALPFKDRLLFKTLGLLGFCPFPFIRSFIFCNVIIGPGRIILCLFLSSSGARGGACARAPTCCVDVCMEFVLFFFCSLFLISFPPPRRDSCLLARHSTSEIGCNLHLLLLRWPTTVLPCALCRVITPGVNVPLPDDTCAFYLISLRHPGRSPAFPSSFSDAPCLSWIPSPDLRDLSSKKVALVFLLIDPRLI